MQLFVEFAANSNSEPKAKLPLSSPTTICDGQAIVVIHPKKPLQKRWFLRHVNGSSADKVADLFGQFMVACDPDTPLVLTFAILG